MAEELPLLIASLDDERARELEAASRVGKHVWVDLKWAPAEEGPHLLEVYLPTTNEPLRFLAEPLGTEGERGFAVRLYPWEEPEEMTSADALPPDMVEVPQDALIGRSLAKGRFEILSTIGEGSIGAVYRARHTGLGIVVAVKVLHEAFQKDREFCKRFEAEALALSRLDHPNLVHIYDFGQEPDGLLYIAMSYVEGETLRDLMKRERDKLNAKRIAQLMLQVCAGLSHAHNRGLIHRDVKPDNVMITRKEDDDGNVVENVKVLDFGFAVPASVTGEVAQRLAGTPVYMSPEQCLGRELDVRSDVYACGIMLYEMAVGIVPFLGRDTDSIRKKQVSMPAPKVSAAKPDADPRLERIVEKSLSKRRSERHPSMQDLRTELKTLLTADDSMRLSNPHLSVQSLPVARDPGRPPVSVAPELREPTPFEQLADELAQGAELPEDEQLVAGAIRVLAERADAATLVRLNVGALDATLLAPIAAALLQGNQTAGTLLRASGVAGAYALYGARTKIAADQNARIAFITTMKSLGESALPVVRAALERIFEATMSGRPGVDELAEELLLSMPSANDELAGQLIVRFAQVNAPNVVRAAARALPRVAGERAHDVLVHLLAHDDEGVRIACIVSLREIKGVGEVAIAKLAELSKSGMLTSNQVKAAALGALSDAQPAAKAKAQAVIQLLSS